MRNFWSFVGTSLLVALFALRLGLMTVQEFNRGSDEPRDVTLDIEAWRASNPHLREVDRIQKQMAPLRAAGKDAKITADSFVAALRNGQAASAYEMTSSALRDRFDSFEFEEYVMKRAIQAQPQDVKHSLSESINGSQRHYFEVRDANGRMNFTLVVAQENNGWNVAEITFVD